MQEKLIKTENRRKLLLTSDNVSKLAKNLLIQNHTSERTDALKRDWKSFIRSEFRLTKLQKENLQAIPAEESEKIQKALAEAVDQGGEVHLKFDFEAAGAESVNGSGGELRISEAGTGESDLSIGGRVSCTFAADCTNWHCKPEPGSGAND
jgi:hypothetical protein